MHYRTTLPLMLALAIASIVLADDGERSAKSTACPKIQSDADIWMVKSGGLWEDGTRYGNFRVRVIRKGVEHAIDYVEVQVTDVSDSGRSVRHCTSVQSPGLKGYVSDIRIHAVGPRAAVVELDVVMKAMDGVILKEVLLASWDGRVQTVTEAKYVDVQALQGR